MATISGNQSSKVGKFKKEAIARRASRRGFNVRESNKSGVTPPRQGVSPVGNIQDAINRRRSGSGRGVTPPGNMSPNPPSGDLGQDRQSTDLGSRIRLLAGARNKSSIR